MAAHTDKKKTDPRVDIEEELQDFVDDLVDCQTGTHKISSSMLAAHDKERRARATFTSYSEMSPDDALLRLLITLQMKLEAKALNGGFDVLEEKIDAIKQGQEETNSDIKDIKEALYDPTDGVFSKVRDAHDNITKAKSELTIELTEVKKWKKTVMTVIAFVVCGIGTGFLGLFGKAIWSWLVR